MKGSLWMKSLPACEPVGPVQEQADALRERARRVLEIAPTARFEWAPLVLEEVCLDGKVHRAELLVMADAMLVGEPGDWVRPTAPQTTQQLIADRVGALLPTEKILDGAWLRAALRLKPQTMAPDSRMASTGRVFENSRMVDEALRIAGFEAGGYRDGAFIGIIGSVGKAWVITNRLIDRPKRAANAGWHTSYKTQYRTPGGVYVLQPLGLAHNDDGKGPLSDHDDYSQKVAYFVKNTCTVDGAPMSTADLYQHPVFSKLVSYEGPMKLVRHPAVPLSGAGGTADEVPVIRLGDRGENVKTWQRYLLAGNFYAFVGAKGTIDGEFGPKTQAATREAQRANGLNITGEVDAATLSLMGQLPTAPRNPGSGGPFAGDVARYTHTSALITSRKLARFFTALPRVANGERNIRLIVLHTMEALETAATAENCAQYFATTRVQASAHFCIDSDSIVQCVPMLDVAYAAPKANSDGVHIELAGYARQSEAEWDDTFSRAELELCARLMAALSKDCNIPLRFLTRSELKAGERGVTTHQDCSAVFGGTHQDPGKHFPMTKVIGLAQMALLGQ